MPILTRKWPTAEQHRCEVRRPCQTPHSSRWLQQATSSAAKQGGEAAGSRGGKRGGDARCVWRASGMSRSGSIRQCQHEAQRSSAARRAHC